MYSAVKSAFCIANNVSILRVDNAGAFVDDNLIKNSPVCSAYHSNVNIPYTDGVCTGDYSFYNTSYEANDDSSDYNDDDSDY